MAHTSSGSVDIAPEDYAERLARAIELVRLRDLDAAQPLAMDLARLAPDQSRPVLLLARIAEARNDPAQAVRILGEYLARGKDDPAVKRHLAQTLEGMNRFAQARALIDEILATGATFMDHWILGRIHIAEGNLEQAEACAREAQRLAPDQSRPVLLLARIAEARNDPAQAVRILGEYLARGKDDPAVKRHLAQTLEGMNRFAQARALIDEILASGGATFMDHWILGRIHIAEGNLEQAEASAREAQRLAPDQSRPVLLLARIAEARNDPAQAVRILGEYLARGKDDPAVKRHLAQTLEGMNRFAQARALIDEILASGGATFMDHWILGRIHIAEGNLEQAEASAREAQRLAPDQSRPVLLLARIAEARNDPAQAVRILGEYLARGKDDPAVKRHLAQTLEGMNRFAQARALIDEILATGAATFMDHWILGRIHIAEGNLEQAEASAREAQRLAPRKSEPVLLKSLIAHLQHGVAGRVEALRAGLRDDKEDVGLRLHLVIRLADLGRTDEALEVARSIDIEKCADRELLTLSSHFEMLNANEEAQACTRQVQPDGPVGLALLISDHLNGSGNHEEILRLKATRERPEDRTSRALLRFFEEKTGQDQAVDRGALGARLLDNIADYKGAEEYFVNEPVKKLAETPLVSILAPIHRASDQDNLLRQLLRQDYPNLEAVIVINGSGIDSDLFRRRLGKQLEL
jgi:Flp pilus assembly protein TadD